MSIEAVSAVLNMDVSDPLAKLVLIGLANHANHDAECWPSQTTLARYASCSRQTVNVKSGWLEKAGLIESRQRHVQGGMKSVKVYKLNLPDVKITDSESTNRKKPDVGISDNRCQDGATTDVNPSRQQMSTRGDIEPSIEPSIEPAADAFERVCLAAGLTLESQSESEMSEWLGKGCDLEEHVLPTVRRVAGRQRDKGEPVGNLRYFRNAVLEAKSSGTDSGTTPSPATTRATHLRHYIETGEWRTRQWFEPDSIQEAKSQLAILERHTGKKSNIEKEYEAFKAAACA